MSGTAALDLTGAQIVLRALADHGVDTIFGYPGGAVLPIYDEIFKQEKVRHVLVRQEGGALHAAIVGETRGRTGDLWPRRYQRGDRPDRCLDGFDPACVPDRAGRNPPDRL